MTTESVQKINETKNGPAFCAGYLAGYATFLKLLRPSDAETSESYMKIASWFNSQADKLGVSQRDRLAQRTQFWRGQAEIHLDTDWLIANPSQSEMPVVDSKIQSCYQNIAQALPDSQLCLEHDGQQFHLRQECLPKGPAPIEIQAPGPPISTRPRRRHGPSSPHRHPLPPVPGSFPP